MSASDLVECPDCGTEMARSGLGNHRAAHRRAIERAGTDTSARRSAPAAAASSGPSSGLDVALVVLRQAAPGGSVAIEDLPVVIEWIAMTHEVVGRLRSPAVR